MGWLSKGRPNGSVIHGQWAQWAGWQAVGLLLGLLLFALRPMIHLGCIIINPVPCHVDIPIQSKCAHTKGKVIQEHTLSFLFDGSAIVEGEWYKSSSSSSSSSWIRRTKFSGFCIINSFIINLSVSGIQIWGWNYKPLVGEIFIY